MKSVSVFFVAVAAVTLGITLAGCPSKSPTTTATTTQQTTTNPDEPPAIVPSTSPQSDLPGDKPAPGKMVTVYSVEEDKDGNQSLKSKEVPVASGDEQTPATFAMQTLISEQNSPLPKGTTLHGVKIADGVATVDFSKEIKDNFPGGDTAEALLINAVTSTLGQFHTVKSVQFLVDGKKIDSIGGNQTLDQPLPVPQAGGGAEGGSEPPGGGG